MHLHFIHILQNGITSILHKSFTALSFPKKSYSITKTLKKNNKEKAETGICGLMVMVMMVVVVMVVVVIACYV